MAMRILWDKYETALLIDCYLRIVNGDVGISNIITYFENALKCAKFLVGPTMLRPGPMLLMVAAIAVKLVVKSLPSNEIRKTESENIIINVIK